MKAIIIKPITTFILTVLFLISCTRKSEEQIQILNHQIKSDTISVAKSLFTGFSKNSLIDMKFNNDSIFLYAVVEKNDKYYLITYLINDSIRIINEKDFSNKICQTIVDKNCDGIFVINSDSLIFSSDIAFYFYSFSKDTIYYNTPQKQDS